jgi:hypothetical protein
VRKAPQGVDAQYRVAVGGESADLRERFAEPVARSGFIVHDQLERSEVIRLASASVPEPRRDRERLISIYIGCPSVSGRLSAVE